MACGAWDPTEASLAGLEVTFDSDGSGLVVANEVIQISAGPTWIGTDQIQVSTAYSGGTMVAALEARLPGEG